MAAAVLSVFIIGAFTLFGENQLRVLGGALLLCFALLLVSKRTRIASEGLLYLTWVLWSTTGFAVALNQQAFTGALIVVLQVAGVIFAVAGIAYFLGKIEIPMAAVVLGGLFSAMVAFSEGGNEPGDVVRRAVGSTYNPNGFAFQMLLSVGVLLLFWPKANTMVRKTIVWALGAIFVYGIITSGSRKMFLALVLLFILWAVTALRTISRSASRYVLGFCLIVLVLQWFVGFVMGQTIIGRRFHRDFGDRVTIAGIERYDRTLLYKDALGVFVEHPVSGVGLGNFKYYSYSSQEAHSDYMEVLSTTGLPGFLLYFGIFFVLWRRLGRIQKWCQAWELYRLKVFRALIITLLFTSLGMPNYIVPVFWVFVASICGYTHRLESMAYRAQSQGRYLRSPNQYAGRANLPVVAYHESDIGY